GGDFVGVEVSGVSGGVLQIPEDVAVDAGDAVDGDVGQSFVPAYGLVNLGAQAQSPGDGIGAVSAAGDGVPGFEVGPDEHQLAGAECITVGHRRLFVSTVPGAGVDKGTQLLCDGDQGGGDRLAVQGRHTEDARGDAQFGLGRQQCLHAGVLAALGAADDVTGSSSFVGALLHPNNDGERAGLVGNGLQAAGQRALAAGIAQGGANIGQQDRFIQGKNVSVGIFGCTHHANYGGGDGADGDGGFVDFDDADAVMVLIGHGDFPAVREWL